MDEKLETDLCPGVAGSGDDAVDIRQFRLAERKAFEIFDLLTDRGVREFAKNIRRGRPLNSDIDPAIGAGFGITHITDGGGLNFPVGLCQVYFCFARLQCGQICFGFRLIRGVNDDHKFFFIAAVDNNVIKNIAGGIEEIAVLCRADLQCSDVVGRNRVEKAFGIRACNLKTPMWVQSKMPAR